MVFTLNSLKVKDFIISGYVVFLIAPAPGLGHCASPSPAPGLGHCASPSPAPGLGHCASPSPTT